MDDEICSEANRYASNVNVILAEVLLIVVSVINLGILIYLAKTRGYYGVAVHANFKILLWNAWINLFIQMVINIYSHIYMLYLQLYTAPADCRNVFVIWECVLLRFPVTWTVPGISLIHMAAFVERLLASKYHRNYEQTGKTIGITLTIMIWSLMFLIDYYGYRLPDYNQLIPYCTASLYGNQNTVKVMMYTLFSIDICVTCGDLYLQCFNKKKQDGEVHAKIFADYSLSHSFQVNENYLTSRLVFPVSLTHSIFYTIYLIITSSIRKIIDYGENPYFYVAAVGYAHNVLLLSVGLCLIVYANRRGWIKGRRSFDVYSKDKIVDIYFQQFDKQME